MRNLKDTFSNIAGIMIAIAGVILAIGQAGVVVPSWVNTGGVILGIVGAGIISYFTGKNPDGTKKQNPVNV